jgi:CRISPR-associated protein Cas1
VQNRIVEITQTGVYLSKDRGFLTVSKDKEELGKVPLSDISGLICNSHALTFTNNIILSLVEQGSSVVICGHNYLPEAIIWPVESNSQQQLRMRYQINASKPLTKQLWAEIIKQKILNQSDVLNFIGRTNNRLSVLAKEVKSGDKDNLEAQAARIYWTKIFGDEFTRDRMSDGINSMLNYGYTILRSTVARSIMAVGLHPTLGIHHHNQFNPMCLVDDMMEPFRPLIDLLVYYLNKSGHENVSEDVKRYLANSINIDLETEDGNSPLFQVINKLSVSLAQSYEQEKVLLRFPIVILPVEIPDLP